MSNWKDELVISTKDLESDEHHIQIINIKSLADGDLSQNQTFRFPLEADYNESHIMNPVSAIGSNFEASENPVLLFLRDDDWQKEPSDRLELFEVDLDAEPNSPASIKKTEIPLASFNTYDIQDEFMSSTPQYYRFENHECIVFCFTTRIDVNSSRLGVRWVELRKEDGGEWYNYQEGTFGPDDSNNRMFPSIAINKDQQMLLTYNLVDEDEVHNICVTGREVNDPLGVMSRSESKLTSAVSNNEMYDPAISNRGVIGIDPLQEGYFWWTANHEEGAEIYAVDFLRSNIDLEVERIVDFAEFDEFQNIGETINLQVKNKGLTEFNEFTIQLYLNDRLAIEEVKSLTIPYLESRLVTLDAPLNFPSVGTYTVRVELKMDGDEINANNIFEQTVHRRIDVDPKVRLVSIDKGCSIVESLGLLEFELVNEGLLEIENAHIKVYLNDHIVYTINAVDLALEPDEKAKFSRTYLAPEQEENKLLIEIVSIEANGMEFLINEEQEFIFYRTEEFFKILDVSLNLDESPRDVTWTIKELQTGKLVAEGGPYAEKNETVVTRLCLNPYHCYLFEIFDAGGDGIITTEGAEAYSLQTDFGTPILSKSGNFGSQSVHGFCIDGPRCQIKPDLLIEPASDQDSQDGSVDIQVLNRIESFRYRVGGVGPFVETSNFENLKSGFHLVEVFSDFGMCEYVDTLFIPHLGTVMDSEILTIDEMQVFPNPSSGQMQIYAPNLVSKNAINKVSVYDLQGRVHEDASLFFDDNFMATLDLSHLPKGIYILKMRTKDQSFITKLSLK